MTLLLGIPIKPVATGGIVFLERILLVILAVEDNVIDVMRNRFHDVRAFAIL